MIIAAFEGAGKTTFARTNSQAIDISPLPYMYSNGEQKNDLAIYGIGELDSSARTAPEWRATYIEAVEHMLEYYDAVCVPIDPDIMNALWKRGHNVVIVRPKANLKDAWERRLREREDSEEFVRTIIDHWNEWMETIDSLPFSIDLAIDENEYVSDAVTPSIIENERRFERTHPWSWPESVDELERIELPDGTIDQLIVIFKREGMTLQEGIVAALKHYAHEVLKNEGNDEP